MKKKLTALLLVVVLVAALIAGATLSYFTDTDTVTNTFTVGDVDIDVYEHKLNADGTLDPNTEVDSNFYGNIVPGVEYKKDPTIENIGPNGAYARMMVTVPNDLFQALAAKGVNSLDALFVGYDANKWAFAGNVTDDTNNAITYVYNYIGNNGVLAAGTKATLFTAFKLPDTLTQEDLANWDAFYIVVEGQAIQAEGFDSQQEALDELGQVSNFVPVVPEIVTSTAELSATINSLNAAGAPEAMAIVLPKTAENAPITTNISIPGGKDVTISGASTNPADTVINGQIAALSSGTLVIKNCTINVDGSVNDSTNISQTGSSGIAVWGNQDVICENVVFNMSLADSTAITAWWSTNDGANITVRNCTFNCNGQRPIRSDASVTVENCTFNDPYRYAVQMTSKASTITAEGNAVVNFKNNTINAGTTSSKPVYGVQLEGETYGCSNLTINGSGNTINLGSTGKTGTMYVYEGTAKIHDITWNVTDGTPTDIS